MVKFDRSFIWRCRIYRSKHKFYQLLLKILNKSQQKKVYHQLQTLLGDPYIKENGDKSPQRSENNVKEQVFSNEMCSGSHRY